ncbi:polyprenol monophosphomannose synthase [Microbacterium aurum]
MTLPSVLVIIPTYNESENIRPIIGRVLAAAPEVSVLVVDDGSPDGTGRIADELAEADARIHVLHRTGKGGLGAAYLAGFDWAGAHDFEYVVELDADGSHPPEVLPRMLAVMTEGAGAVGGVIGSRWVDGGGVVNWPLTRQLISRGGSTYARIMLGVPVKDVTAGYRVYPTALLATLGLDSLESKGYCFQIDLTRRVAATGKRLVEVPIEFRERERGESKMSGAIVVEAMGRVTVWGFQRWGRILSRPFRRNS